MNKYDMSFAVAFPKTVFAWVLLGLIGTSSLRAQTPLNNANFQSAVNLWFSDEANATATYGHINDWNVTGVTNMQNAFKDRASFNEDISGWDVSNVERMGSMFDGALNFNQPINNWDTSKVTQMGSMFNGATAFNQPIGDWNVSSVLSMSHMFYETPFNQPIGDWNVSAVTNMQSLFGGTPFNQPIGNWVVSSVSNMRGMFAGSLFNHPIENWNISSVIDMRGMFSDSLFNQDLGKWNIANQATVEGMFEEADSLSIANRKKIHAAFSSNPNWNYDWATFYRPLPQAMSAQAGTDLNYTFNGKILATGGMPVTGVAFELADNMLFQKAQTHPANLVDGNFSVSLILEGGKRYYYRAVATNEVGTTRSGPKRLVTPDSKTYWWSDSFSRAAGWRSSPWFGTFRPHESGWIYHLKLGWAYAQPDGSGGLWLWMRDHRWAWTREGAYPYFWKHADGSWHYLLGTQNGQPVFYEWKGASSSASKL